MFKGGVQQERRTVHSEDHSTGTIEQGVWIFTVDVIDPQESHEVSLLLVHLYVKKGFLDVCNQSHLMGPEAH